MPPGMAPILPPVSASPVGVRGRNRPLSDTIVDPRPTHRTRSAEATVPPVLGRPPVFRSIVWQILIVGVVRGNRLVSDPQHQREPRRAAASPPDFGFLGRVAGIPIGKSVTPL